MTDLARGRPPEEAMRACLLATALARSLRLSESEAAAVYYTTMLRSVGCTATSHEYAAASADPFVRRIAGWFEGYDALVTPTLARGPVPLGTWAGKGWVRTMLGVGNWLYTTPWNLAGYPAASVPFGSDDGGLPLGLQLVAPAGAEAVVLALAAQIEQLRPWPRLAPADPPGRAPR